MKKIATLLVTSVTLAACGGEAEQTEQQTPPAEMKGKMVVVSTVKTAEFRHYVEVQGMVDAEENVGVTPQKPGVVTKIYVEAGQSVSKGQLLAELNNAGVSQQIDAMRTQLALAKVAYEKQKNLWDKKIGSEMQFLQAKAQKEALEQQIAGLSEQGDMSRIESPINGVVDAVHAKVGQAAAPGYPAFQVVNLSSLKVKGQVPEKYAPNVKSGSDVVLNFLDIKKEVSSKASYAAKVIDPLTRTFTVEVKLDAGSSADFHPNMIVVLKIVDYKNEKAIVVPTDVVQRGESSSYIYTVLKEGGKNIVKKRVVQVGSNYNGNTEILSGLAEGEMVITRGYQNVNEGDEVQL
ncbi:MAG: efflux RND transporter periplasmic adaptor subunit [Flavobacteriales bacterium]